MSEAALHTRLGGTLAARRLKGGQRATPFTISEIVAVARVLGARLDYLLLGREPMLETEAAAQIAGNDLGTALHNHVVARLCSQLAAAPDGVAQLVLDRSGLLAAGEKAVEEAFVASRLNRMTVRRKPEPPLRRPSSPLPPRRARSNNSAN